MQLRELLKEIYAVEFSDSIYDREIVSICSDSRIVKKGSLFVALEGDVYNGLDYVEEAIEKGAMVIVAQKEYSKKNDYKNICFLTVDDPKAFLRSIVKRFYGEPSKKLKTIGITGTNGKTTITYLIEAILDEAGKSCGVMGTVNYRVAHRIMPSKRTTPDIIETHQFLSELVSEGVDYCIMEVSSHALVQGRVDLIDFKGAVFTNLTDDHLDYHKTKDNYFSAKAQLFKNLSSEATSVINVDDNYGKKLISLTSSNILTYGINKKAQVMAKDIQQSVSGTQFKLVCDEGEAIIRTKLVGLYNVYNILAAITICLSEGIWLDKIKASLEHFDIVPGRLERIDCGQDFTIFIDYAHTADALMNVLQAIRDTSDARIILLFGCGGNRDKTKRPEMGKVADHLADFSIITTDNPRNEDPEDIIDDIVKGFESDDYMVVVQREEAIKKALDMAQANDIVLIAGKGHEDYQEFKGRTIKFDEKGIIRQYLRC